MLLYEASFENLNRRFKCLFFLKRHSVQLYAVITQTANIDLFLFPLFCCGCTRILQQVCSFIFLHVEYFFLFLPTPFESSFQDLCLMDLPCCPFLPSLLIPNCARKMLLSCPVLQVTLDCTHHPPSVRLSPRLSDLSLCSMHPCPIPDAEAHGKDGNNCPEQLCLPNGEVFHLHLHSGLLYSISSLLSTEFYCNGAGIVL